MNTKKYVEMFKVRDPICVSHYPLPISKHTPEEVAKHMELGKGITKEVVLYLHIPFCDSICSFCPFNSYIKTEDTVKRYLSALMEEIRLYAKTEYGKHSIVRAISLGGGTPTSLSAKQLKTIIKEVKSQFQVSSDVMIFVEGNPRNFSSDKLEELREVGLDRISVGVQTFQHQISDTLKLYHSVEDSERLVANAKRAGIENVGIDLMYNLPGQTLEDWRKDIQKAIALEIDHICLISFCVVPKTKIAKRIADGEVSNIGDVYKEIELYNTAKMMLEKAGYEQYSIIDFAKPGKADQYAMLSFTEQADLIGLGAAAFGFINGYMYINCGDLNEYIGRLSRKELPVVCGEKANEEERAHGMMARGLRMLRVDTKKFKECFGKYPQELFQGKIQELISKGLLEKDDNSIQLTHDGIIWGNNVCKEFFSDKYRNYGLNMRMRLAKGKAVE
jgi:putative oxygen-independent coproporphyrinogen III oxidase